MKKLLLITAIAGLTCLSLAVTAQNEKGDKGDKGDKGSKESQEIIIRKKGDKDAKITVEISGDKVTINGKPLAEFKDDQVTINRRNIIIRDGKGNQRYTFSPRDFEGLSGTWSDDNAGSRAFLGVTTEKADGGARITDITKESAAEKAGLKEGDVIVKLGDRNIDGPDALYDAVSGQKPKDEVKLSYKRDGKESSTKAVLGERKNSGAMAYSFTGPDGMARTYTIPRVNPAPKVEMWNDRNFGETFPKIYSPGLGETYNYFGDMYPRQQKLGLKIQDTEDGKGVKVLDVDKDSPAEKAGLKKDDIVTEIGGEKVSNTDEAREQLHDNAEKGSYNIKATRNGNAMSFDIKIPKKLKTANL
ncbi:MAG: PDZ domain-containing protein [Ferruginibacter sp.]|nr:PDZ domain-containing protein [Ferruginibacter sp.]MBU9936516.1 PDZ domain-containing protein [Ferruginibacter sp.]HQY11051.1 PDZ domain-containing protein [Ferruginibacter sp.]